jgi:hypothetical protein
MSSASAKAKHRSLMVLTVWHARDVVSKSKNRRAALRIPQSCQCGSVLGVRTAATRRSPNGKSAAVAGISARPNVVPAPRYCPAWTPASHDFPRAGRSRGHAINPLQCHARGVPRTGSIRAEDGEVELSVFAEAALGHRGSSLLLSAQALEELTLTHELTFTHQMLRIPDNGYYRPRKLLQPRKAAVRASPNRSGGSLWRRSGCVAARAF